MAERIDWRERGTSSDVVIELYPDGVTAAEREESARVLRRLVYDFVARDLHARRAVLNVLSRLGRLPGNR
ncbi:MAG TPA: hypothetical protein VIF09_04775, partial [Polyangiaceae bacterium]